MINQESILDRPRNSLDSFVWDRTDYGFKLTNTAKYKINKILSWVLNSFNIDYFGANITGSITSNQYTEDSDIDLHITSPQITQSNQEALNRELRLKYENEFKLNNEDDTFIANHPIEVYFQINSHQDMMSVGCYDVLADEWRSGPDFEDMDFDPYDEYYEDDVKFINDVVKQIRNIILECYEISLVIKNSTNEDFKVAEYDYLKQSLEKASDVFLKAKNARKIMSAPESDEEALEMRDSKEWKVADSAFKLMDKFGYLKILKECQLCIDDIKANNTHYNVIIDRIINVIRDNIANNKSVQDDDRVAFQTVVDESMKSVGIYAILAGLLAIPGVVKADRLEKELQSIPKSEFSIDSPSVTKAVNNSSTEKKQFNGLSYANLTNLIATIVYNEAMIDYLKFKDENCLIAIGNVINNRAGGEPDNFADVITQPKQFYSAKHIIGGVKDSDYIMYYPYGGYVKCWNLCNEVASKLIDGKLKNVIGNRNMIANAKIDNPEEYNKWGKHADLAIGSHTFGYAKERDGFRNKRIQKNQKSVQSNSSKPNIQQIQKNKNKTDTPKTVKKNVKKNTVVYKVKKGDTLSSIAKKYKTTVSEILKKNTKIKTPDRISVGQKIIL